MPRPGNAGPPIDPALTTRIVEFNDIAALERELTHGDVALGAARARADEHRHRPSRTRIPRRAARDHTRARLAARDRRDAHDLRRPGWRNCGMDLDPDVVVVGKPIGVGSVPRTAQRPVRRRCRRRAEGPHTDVSGIGGTLTGSALALAAIRDTLSQRFTPADFDHMIPLAEAWTAGSRPASAAAGFDWSVQVLGARAEYCSGPRRGTGARRPPWSTARSRSSCTCGR